MKLDRMIQTALRPAGLLVLCGLALQACTVSGAGFLTTNSDGALEPYAYPLKQTTGSSIEVREGDTLFSIAQNNQIDLAALILTNGLKDPYELTVGDVLRIPGPNLHVVAEGDTVFSISTTYNIDTMTLAAINNLYEPYDIKVGQKLQLPAGVQSKSVKAKGSGWRLGSSAKKKAKVAKTSKGKSTRSLARATPRGGGKFLWPAHGTIISAFGGKGSGKKNDGINIAVEMNSRILAANDGTVTYVGNEVRSYGNLVLIRHKSDWITAYAHMSDVWVVQGQAVERGQHIANAGQSGDADRPQIHFELRRGQKTYDPEKYLNLK